MTITLNGEPARGCRTADADRPARSVEHRPAARGRRAQPDRRQARQLRQHADSGRRPDRDREFCWRRIVEFRPIGDRRPHVHVAPDRRHRQVLVVPGDAARARGVWRRHGDGRRAPREHQRSDRRNRSSTTSTRRRSRCCRTPPAATRPMMRCGRRGSGAKRGLSNWVKLEVIGDERTLFPDNEELHRRDENSGEGRVRRPAVHDRRSDRVPEARGCRRRGRDAARRADRLRPWHSERQQHPHHSRVFARADHPRRGRRHRVGRDDRDGAGGRRRADEHGDRRSTGPHRDGRRR